MFQYAASKALAAKLATDLKIDTTFYKKNFATEIEHQRRYLLNTYFQLHAPLLTAAESQLLTKYSRHIGYRLYKKTSELLGLPSPFRFYQEKTFAGYEPGIHGVSGRIVYLHGGFQSEKYFMNCADSIREDFTFRSIDPKNASIAEQMQEQESIAIHIRRGDYVQSPYHNTCSVDYYLSAMQRVEATVAKPFYYIFSDDIDWVKEQLNISADHEFITHNNGDDSYKDMYLMSQCRHNIIANSSFSWWGAWLNQYGKKVVIAPEDWLSYHQVSARSIVPDAWLTL